MDGYDALRLVCSVLKDVAEQAQRGSVATATVGAALDLVASRIEYAVIGEGLPSFDVR